MTKQTFLRFGLCVRVSTGIAFPQAATRINKSIELLSEGQPNYYTGSHEGMGANYEAGKAMAKTWAHYINFGMEHAPVNPSTPGEFMRGLSEGGGTKDGHRMPAVVVTLPTD